MCDLGWTDTDDCIEAIDDQKPVQLVPLYIHEPAPPTPPGLLHMGLHVTGNAFTIVIPNTVSLVRGSRHRKDAEQLIDFLLSAETELTLANSKSRQIPLGKVDKDRLPNEVRSLVGYLAQGYDLRKLENTRREGSGVAQDGAAVMNLAAVCGWWFLRATAFGLAAVLLSVWVAAFVGWDMAASAAGPPRGGSWESWNGGPAAEAALSHPTNRSPG